MAKNIFRFEEDDLETAPLVFTNCLPNRGLEDKRADVLKREHKPFACLEDVGRFVDELAKIYDFPTESSANPRLSESNEKSLDISEVDYKVIGNSLDIEEVHEIVLCFCGIYRRTSEAIHLIKGVQDMMTAKNGPSWNVYVGAPFGSSFACVQDSFLCVIINGLNLLLYKTYQSALYRPREIRLDLEYMSRLAYPDVIDNEQMNEKLLQDLTRKFEGFTVGDKNEESLSSSTQNYSIVDPSLSTSEHRTSTFVSPRKSNTNFNEKREDLIDREDLAN